MNRTTIQTPTCGLPEEDNIYASTRQKCRTQPHIVEYGGTQSCGEGGAKLPTFNRRLPVAELTQCCMTPQEVVQITRMQCKPLFAAWCPSERFNNDRDF